MTPIEKARLHDIAHQTLKTWIEQQIFETAQPPSNPICEDQVKCVVDKAINWRRDYIAALTTARNFTTLSEYDNAISILGSKARPGKAQTNQHILDVANSTNSRDFNDAAHALLSPMAFSAQEIFLGKIRRVFMYLHGTMTAPDDFKHIRPHASGNTQHLFTIMQDQGTFDEWKTLIDKIPTPQATAYRQHLQKIPSP